jgi:hypothetical protein
MTNQWYLARSGQQYGPYSLEQLRQFAAEGRLMPNDMIAGVGEQQWRPAETTPGLVFRVQPPVALAATIEPGRVAPTIELSPAGAAAQPLPETRSALDAALGIAILLSCIFWLFIGGPLFLFLTGMIWLVAGIRIALTGKIPDTKGKLHYRPHYRFIGVVLAILGVFMGLGQLAMLVG